MKNLNIRKPVIKDIHDIVALCKAHAEFERSDYEEEGKELKLAKSLFLDYPPLECLLVELDNEPVGYATFMKQYSTWDASFYVYMDCLFLKEKARSKGIGELLVKEIKKYARQEECDHIQWQTPEFNKRAIKFYFRIGATSKSKERFFLSSK